ncbi:magnesium transporter [bacterium]|nr:magnesium transporter [bacterium]
MDKDRQEIFTALVNNLLEALHENDEQKINSLLADCRIEDIAEIIESLNREEQIAIIKFLDDNIIADVFSKLDPDTITDVADEYGTEFVAKILEDMPSEEAAEAISEMRGKEADELLDLMETSESEKVKKILEYPEDTAGRIMNSDFVALNENTSPEKVIEYIRHKQIEEPFYYIYVVDNKNIYKGMVPIHKIIFASSSATLGNLIDKEENITVSVSTDQEDVAKIVEKYDIPALPVLDENKKLVGRITVDDIIDVINEENTEDIYKMAGTDYEELFSKSAFKIARIRLPWLITCIFGSLLTGLVIRRFELTLASQIALVSFIPVIMSTGGNTGLQSSTIMVRRMALGDISVYNIIGNILKEIRTALILGCVCGLVLMLIAKIWRGDLFIGLIVGISMFFAVSASCIIGLLIPILFKKIKIDPAVASGPLITTLNDLVGLTIYLLLSTIFLNHIL